MKIIKILFVVSTAVCFISGNLALCAGKTDTGTTLIFFAAVSCFLTLAVIEAYDSSWGMAGAMTFLALIFVALMINNIQGRVLQPVVTDCCVMNTSFPDGPFLLTDTNMHCSPVSIHQDYFQCVGWEISRYSRCKNCGRQFLHHYVFSEIMPLEQWQALVRRRRAQNEAFANCPEL